MSTDDGDFFFFFKFKQGDPLYGTLPQEKAQPCVIKACAATAATDSDIISSFPGWTRPALKGGIVHDSL